MKGERGDDGLIYIFRIEYSVLDHTSDAGETGHQSNDCGARDEIRKEKTLKNMKGKEDVSAGRVLDKMFHFKDDFLMTG